MSRSFGLLSGGLPRPGGRWSLPPSALFARLPRELTERLESGLLRSGKALLERAEPKRRPFPTTLPVLDRLLDGGVGRGETVECIGRRTSGRFSLVLATLAAATHAGEAAALVDLGDHLDPQVAAHTGIELERLLWLRPRHLKEALASTEVVLSGGFPLVILDLGTPPVPGGRGAEASWLRLARAARDHRAALLVSSPYRVSGTAAGAVFELRSGRGRWLGRSDTPRLLGGLRSRIGLEKLRGHAPGSGTSFELRLPSEALPTTELAFGASPDSAPETTRLTTPRPSRARSIAAAPPRRAG